MRLRHKFNVDIINKDYLGEKYMGKTLFLHLSDIHVISNTPVDKITSLIAKSIASHNNNELCRVFILFTGDMTREAEKDQFSVFNKFLSNVSNKIENEFHIHPRVFVVPGNHDINIKGKKYPEEELINGNDDKKKELLEKQMSYMEDAIRLCNKYGSFADNKLVSICEEELDVIKYRFISLNTAPFSAMEKRDKEHHFIDKKSLNFPADCSFGKKTLTVLLSHHRPDWFDEETSSILNKYIDENVSIAFFGHEHNPTYEIKEGENGKYVYDAGGELISKNQIHNAVDGSFSFSYFDEEKCIIKRFVCKLNYKSNSFTFTDDDQKETKIRTIELLPITEPFKENFYRGPLHNNECNILDLFVMPSITNNKDNFELLSIEAVIKKIEKTKEFILEGSAKSGKTTLLKAIFSECQKKGPCIFLSINSPTNDNAKKLVKDAFEEMYGEKIDNSSLYSSFPFEERYIFVDNFEVLKDAGIKKKILDYLRKEFGAIIISYSKNETIEESIKELGLFDQDNIYRTYGITAKGRRQLTEKICKIKGVESEFIDSIYNLFEREINGVSILDFTDPEQGVLLLETIIDQRLYEERNTNKAFTETFRHQLEDSLIRVGKPDDLDSYLVILNSIAFKIWEKQQDIDFQESDLINIYTKCRDEERCLISYKDIQNVIINSGIIYECGNNKFRYRRNSYLSYFASQEIIRLYQQGQHEHLDKLINNLSFGLNSDILLFILFYTKNIQFVNQLSQNANEMYKDINQLDYSDTNNILFSETTSLPKEAERNKVTKREKIERRDKREKQLVVSAERQERKGVSISEEDKEKEEIIKAEKTIEIIGKAVSGFQGIITKEQRKELFNSAYNLIHRLIGKAFNFSNEELEELEKEYLNQKKQKINELSVEPNKNKEEIDRLNNSSIRNFLFGILIEMLTMLESIFAYLATSKQTMSIINELPSEQFENCIFKLYCYLFGCKYDKFIGEISFAKKNFSENKINNLVRFFARLYVIHNTFTKEQFDKICSIAGIKKNVLLAYASREEKFIK